jgi:hypothetical protein
MEFKIRSFFIAEVWTKWLPGSRAFIIVDLGKVTNANEVQELAIIASSSGTAPKSGERAEVEENEHECSPGCLVAEHRIQND